MAISDNYVPIKQLGNGSTDEFSGNWAVFNEDYLRVYLESVTTGVQTLQEITTDYTVEFDESGFIVTFLTPPSSSNYVVIGRSIDLDQEVPYKTSKGFQGKVIEDSLDKLTGISQELRDIVGRTILFPLGSGFSASLAEPVDRGVLYFDGEVVKSDESSIDDLVDAAAAAAASAAAAAISASAAAASAIAADASAESIETVVESIDILLESNNNLKDWLPEIAYSSTTACAKIQAAADAFAAGTNIEPLLLPAGLIILNQTLFLPANFTMIGAGKHSDLREYGDTTGGVDHPLRGTLIYTDEASITARVWTDVTASDTAIKPGIMLMGDNIRLENFTLQTPVALANALETGIHIWGTGRHTIRNVDIRGGWINGGLYFDASMSSINTNLTGLAYLPAWFDADYIALYDNGLTDTLVENCRIYGIKAVTVQGTTRTTGLSPFKWAPNGISDTVLSNCQLYNEGDDATRAASGALVNYDYKVDGANSQGLAFHSCRFDGGAIWLFNLDHCDDISFTGGRTFAETSATWNAYQVGQGVPTAEQRARINLTTETGLVIIEGEIFANKSLAGTGDDRLRDLQYRAEGGKKIIYNGHDGISNPHFWGDFDNAARALKIMSYRAQGQIDIQNLNGGVTTYMVLREDKFDLVDVPIIDADKAAATFKSVTVQTGTGAGTNKMVGTASVQYTPVGNVGAGVDDLMTYTLPANSMSVVGTGVRVKAWGITANNADAKTLAFKVDGNTFLTQAMTTSIAGAWEIEMLFISTGANTQRRYARLTQSTLNGTASNLIQHSSSTEAANTTLAQVIKVTGSATNDNDIVQQGMIVEFLN